MTKKYTTSKDNKDFYDEILSKEIDKPLNERKIFKLEDVMEKHYNGIKIKLIHFNDCMGFWQHEFSQRIKSFTREAYLADQTRNQDNKLGYFTVGYDEHEPYDVINIYTRYYSRDKNRERYIYTSNSLTHALEDDRMYEFMNDYNIIFVQHLDDLDYEDLEYEFEDEFDVKFIFVK